MGTFNPLRSVCRWACMLVAASVPAASSALTIQSTTVSAGVEIDSRTLLIAIAIGLSICVLVGGLAFLIIKKPRRGP